MEVRTEDDHDDVLEIQCDSSNAFLPPTEEQAELYDRTLLAMASNEWGNGTLDESISGNSMSEDIRKEAQEDDTSTDKLLSEDRSNDGISNTRKGTEEKHLLYLANMTWWTTYEDLKGYLKSIGVKDVIDIKIFENRVNGQSKGYCLVNVASEASLSLIFEKISFKELNGRILKPRAATKASQLQCESESTTRPSSTSTAQNNCTMNGHNNGMVTRANYTSYVNSSRGTKWGWSGVPPRHNQGIRPMSGGSGMPQRFFNPIGTAQTNHYGCPPFFNRHYSSDYPNRGMAPGSYPLSGDAGSLYYGSRPRGPLPHMNPAFFNECVANGSITLNGMSLCSNIGSADSPGNSPFNSPRTEEKSLSTMMKSRTSIEKDPEIEEVLSRNMTVCGSAISRATTDSAQGDYASAIETLVTAISLIKSSRAAQDERCLVLIASLHDAMISIEHKHYARTGRHYNGVDVDRRRRKKHSRSKSCSPSKRESRRKRSTQEPHRKSKRLRAGFANFPSNDEDDWSGKTNKPRLRDKDRGHRHYSSR